jgi:membrane fusion protein (multidrug efflux system)
VRNTVTGLGGWGVAVAAMVAGSGCKKAAPPGAPPPPEVGVLTLAPRAVPETFEFTGEVQPFRRVEVRARVDGVIVARPFSEGALVQPGDTLYRLDRVRPEAAYRSALARAENARQNLARLEPLVAQHAVAQQDVDNAHAELEAAEAALAQAKQNLDDTVIRAEIAGRVGRTNLEVGARVTGPADLLTTIDVLDPVYVSFYPSTQQILGWSRDPRSRRLIQPGSALTVQAVLPDGTVLPQTGRLNFVAPSLDATTGTQQFRAEFRNHDHLLLPGQFVRARLVGFARDSAFAVPQRAVQQALGRQFVYVVAQGDTALARDVKPGPWSGNLWIIDQGLAGGDRVIIDGIQKVAPGRPVRPVPVADSVATGDTTAAASDRAGAGPQARQP